MWSQSQPDMGRRLLREAADVLGGSTLIAISSLVTVPMFPVPMTMQSWAVLLVAAILGPRLGMAAVMLYVLEGMAGLPVFAGGASGAARLVGPTGGYLLAFPIAAWIVGWLVRPAPQGTVPVLSVMVLGHVVILAGGCAWLAMFAGFEKAIAAGVTPFIVGSVVKSALLAATLELWRRSPRHRAP